MAISETIIFDNAGVPWVQLSVPIILPGKLGIDTLLSPPSLGDADFTDETIGGTLDDDANYFYSFEAIVGGVGASISDLFLVNTSFAGVNTHKVTITDVRFSDEATQYRVYRSNKDNPSVLKLIQAAASIPSPFSFVDTGLAQQATLAPSSNFILARLYWRELGTRGWQLGAEDDTSPLKFRLPININGKTIELKLVGVGTGGVETSDSEAQLTNYVVVGHAGHSLQPNEAVRVVNPGFEQGDTAWTKGTGWSIVNDPANALKGSWAAKWEGTANAALRNVAFIPVEPGDVVEAKAKFKRTAGTATGGLVRISWLNAAEVEIVISRGNIVTSSTYARSRVAATAPALAAFARIEAELDTAATGNTIFADQFRAVLYPKDLGDVPDGTSRRARTAAHSSYRPTTNPLTATDAGTTATVSVAAFTMRFYSNPVVDVSINSGSITGLAFDTLFFIHYQDDAFAGGAVTFLPATTKESASGLFVGSIRTPKDGGSDTIGNNDGGVGAQYGERFTLLPSTNTTSTTGNGAVANSLNAIDGDNATFGTSTVTGNGASNTAFQTLSGYAGSVKPWKTVTLKIKSEVPTNTLDGATPDSAQIRYSTDGGATFTVVFALVSGTTRALTVDSITLPAGINTANVRVEAKTRAAIGDTTGTAILRLYEAWIEAEAN